MPDGGYVHVVINPVSGRSGGWEVICDLCRRMEAVGWTVAISRTGRIGDARAAATRACSDGARALVVAGGDGTVSEAASGMVGNGVPILVVPRGTENILAKYYGSALDADLLWQTLREGREIAMDIPVTNGRRFMLLAGIGFDAEVVQRLTRERKGHISYLTYFWPLWRTFWSHAYPHLSVEADGVKVFEGAGLAFVGNVPRYAIGLRILDRASPVDGLLDVCVLHCRRQDQLLQHAVNILRRRHVGGRDVIYTQARRVRVQAREQRVPLQLDGDFAGWLPEGAEFEITGVRARFLVRRDWRG